MGVCAGRQCSSAAGLARPPTWSNQTPAQPQERKEKKRQAVQDRAKQLNKALKPRGATLKCARGGRGREGWAGGTRLPAGPGGPSVKMLHPPAARRDSKVGLKLGRVAAWLRGSAKAPPERLLAYLELALWAEKHASFAGVRAWPACLAACGPAACARCRFHLARGSTQSARPQPPFCLPICPAGPAERAAKREPLDVLQGERGRVAGQVPCLGTLHSHSSALRPAGCCAWRSGRCAAARGASTCCHLARTTPTPGHVSR